MNNLKLCTLVLLCLFLSNAHSADIPALKELFQKNFDSYYQPRFCGQNIRRFLEEASMREIDLSNAYVLKIQGGGFLETSGFFTRGNVNEREMLGYFHMILIADDIIFDFDLNRPLVLNKLDYIRLQFTPPHEPYYIFGIDYTKNGAPGNWNVTAFDSKDYSNGKESTLWKSKIKDYIDIKELFKRERPNL